MKKVTVYTDGSCKFNPGPGGWAAVLLYGENQKEISGGCLDTTNNKMELTAVIMALESLKEPCQVEVFSDSKYVVDSVTKRWVYSWQKNDWRKSDKSPALNSELWKKLLPLLEKHEVKFNWVKGHAENALNERCDELAVAQSQKYSK
ncbi:MAG: ribonuclease HI [Oscillospiraceae bacterium]